MSEKVIIRSVGTIDYANGTIDVSDLNIISVTGENLRFMINPASNDVVSEMNQFAMIDPTLIQVTAIPNQDDYLHTNSK